MQVICREATKAAARYAQRMMAAAVLYVATAWSVLAYVQHAKPTGIVLFVVAGLPALSVLAMLWVVAQYLREETDEFKRYQAVISILVAIGATLAVNAFTDSLRSFGAITAAPVFTEFFVFWLTMPAAQFTQKFLNRVRDE